MTRLSAVFNPDTLQTLTALVGVKSAYSLILNQPRFRKLQPDATFAMVFVGVGLCIKAADIDRRRTNPSTDIYALRVKLFLLIGGLPVGIWQASQTVRAFRRLMARAYGEPRYGNQRHRP